MKPYPCGCSPDEMTHCDVHAPWDCHPSEALRQVEPGVPALPDRQVALRVAVLCCYADEERAMSREMVKALEALPKHGISGYEWECSACHYHMAAWEDQHRIPETCGVCDRPITEDNDGQYVDDDGHPCDHYRLIDLDRALEIVRGNA